MSIVGLTFALVAVTVVLAAIAFVQAQMMTYTAEFQTFQLRFDAFQRINETCYLAQLGSKTGDPEWYISKRSEIDSYVSLFSESDIRDGLKELGELLGGFAKGDTIEIKEDRIMEMNTALQQVVVPLIENITKCVIPPKIRWNVRP